MITTITSMTPCRPVRIAIGIDMGPRVTARAYARHPPYVRPTGTRTAWTIDRNDESASPPAADRPQRFTA